MMILDSFVVLFVFVLFVCFVFLLGAKRGDFGFQFCGYRCSASELGLRVFGFGFSCLSPTPPKLKTI